MSTSSTFRRIRVVVIALALTFVANYAISLSVATAAENLPPNAPRPTRVAENLPPNAPRPTSASENLPPNAPRPTYDAENLPPDAPRPGSPGTPRQ